MGWAVGASFLAAATQTDVTFTATPISSMVADALMHIVGGKQEIVSGWTFSTDGYDVSSNQPLYLSFGVGTDDPSDDFEVWQYDGNGTKFVPTDLTFDGTYVSFTTTGLSRGFAITAVPEPTVFILSSAGLVAMLIYVRSKRKQRGLPWGRGLDDER
jgi:hypothetical protein